MDDTSKDGTAAQHYDYGQLAPSPDTFSFLVGWVAEMALVYSHLARMNGPTGRDGAYWDRAAAEIRRLTAMLFGYCVHCGVMAPAALVDDMKTLLNLYGPDGYRASRQAQEERRSLQDYRYRTTPEGHPDYCWRFPSLLGDALKEETGQFGRLCDTLTKCYEGFTDLIMGAVLTAPVYREWLSEEEYDDIEPSTAALLGADLANFTWSITGGQTLQDLKQLIRAFDNERIPFGDWRLRPYMADVAEVELDSGEGDGSGTSKAYRADSDEWGRIKSRLLTIPAALAKTGDMGDPLAPDHPIGRLPEALDRICAPSSSCVADYVDCRPNQVPWNPDDKDYIPTSEAETISQDRITMQALNNETRRNTRIRFMTNGRNRRVHGGDFLAFLFFDRKIQAVPATDEPQEGLTPAQQARRDAIFHARGGSD